MNDQRTLTERLEQFTEAQQIAGKGTLAALLCITRRARDQSPPYVAEDFLTPNKGQVSGVSGAAAQKILREHGINRRLASEGGRTSRGVIRLLRAYLDLLNALQTREMLDFEAIELWWIGRVRAWFASTPFKLRIDSAKSMRSVIADLIEAAFERQREMPGAAVAGAVLQHLVGAKLTTAFPNSDISHHGFSTADAPGGRKGDFEVGDAAIHVTTAPSEGLMRRCRDNLDENLRPIIVTTRDDASGAATLAKNADLVDRIDILEAEQFLAINLYEWSGFSQTQRPKTLRELIAAYNRIVDDCETDPGLRIEIG